MTKRSEVYKCKVCGNIVEVKHIGGGELVCCNTKMSLLNENTTDAATEKHVPVIEKIDGGYKVTVGEVAHPMGDDHYIEWVELITKDDVYTTYLKPGEKPEAIFLTEAKDVTARAYCNLHGNWKNS